MVRQGIRMAREAHRRGVPFYMENPVGFLARRPYMRKWVREWRWVVRKEVHYCAYGHFYHKQRTVMSDQHHEHDSLDANREDWEWAVWAGLQRGIQEEGEVGAQLPSVPGQQGCT